MIWASPAAVLKRILRCTVLPVCAIAAWSVVAMLAGCAGEPARIGERGEILLAPVWLADGSSVLAYSALFERSLLFDVRSGASRDLGIKRGPFEVSRDGRLVFATAGIYTKAWEVASGRLAWQWESGGGTSIGCATGAELALAVGREVALLDAASGIVRAALEAEPYTSVERVTCSPDGSFLARHYREGIVSVWDIAGRRKVGVVRVTETDGLYRIALGPRAEWLAVWAGERIRVFRRDTWSKPGQDFPPDSAPPAVELDVNLRVSDRRGGMERLAIIRHGLIASPNGQYLALAGESKESSGWGMLPDFEQVLVNLDQTHVARVPLKNGFDVAFSPDSSRLAIAGLGLWIWDIRSGTLVTYPKP